uniref:Uncharacterized protein n=2 Tax=Alexandrium monilatum TaxID=311494 RepID=A0A7S4VPB9_9DINO
MGMGMGMSSGDDRLDELEMELMQLRAMRQQERLAGVARPGGGAHAQRPFSPNMQLPPLHGPQLQQPHFVPVPYYSEPPSQQQPQPPAVPSKEHQDLLVAHRELLEQMKDQEVRHTQLLKAHMDLMKTHQDLLKHRSGPEETQKAKNPSLGVVRLDYKYPPAAGDIDCPASFGYDVFYRVVPGLTFEMAQAGKFDEKTEREFAGAIKYLEGRGCHAITGDCGFMMAFQVLARKIATKPIFMSSMCQCPVIAAAFEPHDQILILTANGKSLKPQKEVLLNSCGFDVNGERFVIQGCQDVEGFDAVAKGEEVPIEIVQPGIVKLTKQILKKKPSIKAILLECTELPPYADALRATTGLPVWDAITGADFYINAHKDNVRFGISDWQQEWDRQQEEYFFGANLIEKDRESLVHEADVGRGGVVTKKAARQAKARAQPKTRALVAKTKKKLAKKQAPILGVVRLDYNYPPAVGDIDCPGSYSYDVLFRCVPGLTFEMVQMGKMTDDVHSEFVQAVQWLERKGVCGITGDCGFMMAFQPIASEIANVPVFMSSMVQSPMISVAFDKYDKVLILTANSKTLEPQKEILLSHCGFDVDDSRFVIYGCEDVPGFDAVEKAEQVDVDFVTPGIVKMATEIIKKEPTIRAILLECTELPPYADALRKETGLAVFDAITCADFFVSAYMDNPRFGLNQWQNDWDGIADDYELGQNLSPEQLAKLKNR